MRCANCGNEDPSLLCDEDDTIFCVRCCYRTRKDTGDGDLVICAGCGKLKDRKAYYCRWCGAYSRDSRKNGSSEKLTVRIRQRFGKGNRT